MRGMILAAGRGQRMGALTADRPKCMMALAGRPLVAWQLDALRVAGVGEIAIVRGYQGDAIDADGSAVIDNPRWSDTNMVASLLCAGNWLDGAGSVIAYGDIVYRSGHVRRLMDSDADIAITRDTEWHSLWSRRFDDPMVDAETLQLRSDGTVRDIGRRPHSLDEIDGQYMGLLKVTAEGWRYIREFAEAWPQHLQDSADMTTLLRALVEAGISVATVTVAGGWGEVDSAGDLAPYERMLEEGSLVLD